MGNQRPRISTKSIASNFHHQRKLDVNSMASHADENVTYQQAQDLQRDLERVSVPIAPPLPHTTHNAYRRIVFAPAARMERLHKKLTRPHPNADTPEAGAHRSPA